MSSSYDKQKASIHSTSYKDSSLFDNEESEKVFNIYVSEHQQRASYSNYEHPNSIILAQHVEINQSNPYQGLDNDVWKDLFPIDRQPAAAHVHAQRLSSDVWKEIFPADNPSSLDAIEENLSVVDNNFLRTNIHAHVDNNFNGVETIELWKDKDNPTLDMTSLANSSNGVMYDNGQHKSKQFEDTSMLSNNNKTVRNVNKVFIDNGNLGGDSDDEVFVNTFSTSSLGEVYDVIDDYDYIPSGDRQLTADEVPLVNNGNRASRPLPTIPSTGYALSEINAKRLVTRRSCILTTIVLLLVLVIVGSIVFVVIKFTGAGITTQKNNKTVYDTTTTVEREYNLDARSFLHNSFLIKVINGNGSMSGITVLGSELFVVEGRSSYVNVYSTNSFQLTRKIHVPGSSNLAVIVSSLRTNSLYISDTGLDAIHRYNLSNNSVMSWSLGAKCYGISLTNSGNVLATLYYTKKLVEYTPDGSFIREINLNETLGDPWHSLQFLNDQFIVCHGNDLPEHRVCIVDQVGCIVNCIGGQYGSGVGMFNRPEYLALDSFNNILVTEEYNNRVSLLDSSLNHIGYINLPTYNYLSHPWSLFLDKVNQRIYISEDVGPSTPNGRVFVLAV